MRINSPKLNIMHKACMKASRSLIRDFGEIENLQVSTKGPRFEQEEAYATSASFSFQSRQRPETKGPASI